ncbi:MAG: PAS domain S-box protein [Gammaproteobacteria bacterium]
MTDNDDNEESLLRSVALQNANSIRLARQRAEQELLAAQAALRESTQRITDILESITDGFVAIDSQWRYTYVNPKAEEILRPLRKTPENLIGEVLWQEFPDLLNTPVEQHYRRAMTERVTIEFEFFYPALHCWFGIRIYPAKDGLAIYFQDITRRKQAEEELRQQREWFQVTLASIGDAVITTDTQGQVTFLNPVAEQITGWTADEARGRPLETVFNIINEKTRVPTPNPIAKVLREGIVVGLANHTALIGKNGTETAIEDSAAPIRDTQGNISGAVMVFHDVSGRRKAEDALRSNEEWLRAIFNQAAVGIAVTNLDGRFLETNKRFADIVGYTRDELQQHTFADITHPDDLPETRDHMGQLLAGKISDYSLEKRYVKKDRTVVWSLTTVTLLSDAPDKPGRFIGVIEDISLRKQAEEVRARLAAIVESSDDAIVSKTLDGIIATWNSGAERIFGYAADEVIGQPIMVLIPPDRVEEEQALLKSLKRGEKIEHYETVRVRKDGKLLNIALTVSPVKDAQGNIIGASKIARDITQQKEVEERLRRSEQELRALADSIPQLAWMAEPDGNIFWYNQGWYEYTGTTLQQMAGWGWQSVHDPDILPLVLTRWQESIRTGISFEMEFPLRGADGVFRWFLTRVNPLRDADGRVLRWFGTNTDVDQVKRMRDALQDETRILELLNETGIALGLKLDVRGLIDAVTDAATQLSGAQFGAFFYNTTNEQGDALLLYALSGAPRNAFAGFDQPRATPLFGPTFRGEAPIRCDDVLTDPRYGKMAPHRGLPPGHPPVRSYLAVPVISRSGEVIGGLFFGHAAIGVFTARTERLIVGIAAHAAVAIDNARLYEVAQRAAAEREQLLANERAARAEAVRIGAMKDEFLANLSHELRTPLSAILGWAQVLRRGVKDTSDLNNGLDVIERNARMQAQLIEDLLDMSRIASGKVRLDIQPVVPIAFIEAAVETVRPAAEAKGIRLEKLLDPNAGPVPGDPHRLQQVVWNLLANAIKFTPRDGKVQIVLERVNSHLELRVADTGVGIKPEFLGHVFERFQQADASATRKYGGLGLGLAIVKNLVELHGGTVRVESPGEGRGTTFIVHLPLMVVHSGSRREERTHPSTPPFLPSGFKNLDLSGVKILVVDDERDARDLIRRVLADCDADVFTAANAHDGILLIEKERPHVLVSDIGMPDVDGFEFLKRVRALGGERGGKVPAIALTAFARSEDRTRALHAGYLVHVSKPVEPSELIATVASIAGRTGMTQ